MWRKFIQTFTPNCHFEAPASLHKILELEQILDIKLPEDLRSLLLETNGVSIRVTFPGMEDEEPITLNLIWSVSDILEDNRDFRALDTEDPGHCPPFKSLLFFANVPNGDPVAFQTTGDQKIFAMSHENCDDRTLIASSLQEYLALILQALS